MYTKTFKRGGNGGGAIHLITNALSLDGSILARGGSSDILCDGEGGAGSGGSILVQTLFIEGGGYINDT